MRKSRIFAIVLIAPIGTGNGDCCLSELNSINKIPCASHQGDAIIFPAALGEVRWLLSTQVTANLTLESNKGSKFRSLLHTDEERSFYLDETQKHRHVVMFGSL